MNAANEEAVQAFIDERISLWDIPRVIENVMNQHENHEVSSLEIVLEADQVARSSAVKAIQGLAGNARINVA